MLSLWVKGFLKATGSKWPTDLDEGGNHGPRRAPASPKRLPEQEPPISCLAVSGKLAPADLGVAPPPPSFQGRSHLPLPLCHSAPSPSSASSPPVRQAERQLHCVSPRLSRRRMPLPQSRGHPSRDPATGQPRTSPRCPQQATGLWSAAPAALQQSQP